MDGDACALARGVEPGDDGVVVLEDLRADVRRNAAHRVVRRRHDRHGLGHGVDAEVGAGELRDVRELRLEHLGAEVGAVEEDVVLVRAGTATLGDLEHHAPRDDVAGGEVLDRRGVALHEALAGGVPEDRALAAGALGEEDAESREPGRVELEELHVLERELRAPDDPDAVAGERVGVRRRLEHLPEAAGREDDRLRPEDVELAGRELVRDDRARAAARVEDEVERVVLVVELDAELHAVLEERLEDHVAGAVGRVAGAADRRLAVVAGVAAESPLVDLALGGAV